MKNIILMRHGKSSWKYDVSDRNRPLESRGELDVILVSRELASRDSIPSAMFCSPAIRALSTCKIFTTALEISDNNMTVVEALYDFQGESVINFIKNLSNELNEVMIFGHNHAFTSISNIFGDKIIDNLPTSGLVKLNFAIEDWKDLKSGTTEFIIIPKELR